MAETAKYGTISARIMSEKEGLEPLDDVRAVRILSRGYNLLIMDDYMPTIGEVHGDVIFLLRDGEKKYLGVDGFFKHQGNRFTLFIC